LATEDALALAFGGAAPHAVIDAVDEGVLEARRSDGAPGTDSLGQLDPDPVARKEEGRVHVLALALAHPLGVHVVSVVSSSTPLPIPTPEPVK
jgi:hypothetical protein